MPELALSSFDHQHPNPPDTRMRVNTLNDRNVIPPSIRWEGMRVYVMETQREYQLRGGITNEYWVSSTSDLPANIVDALINSNEPSVSNAFATMQDLVDAGGGADVGNRVIDAGELRINSETEGEFIRPARWVWDNVVKTYSGTVTLTGKPTDPNNRTDIITVSSTNPVSQAGTPNPDPVTPTPTDPTHLVLQTIYRPFDAPDVVNPVSSDPSTANQIGMWLGNDGFTPMYAPIWRQNISVNTYYDFMIAYVAFASDYSTVGQYPMNGLVMVDFSTKNTLAELDSTRTSVKSMGIGNRNSDFVLAMSGTNQATLYARKGAFIGNMIFKFVVKTATVSDASLVRGGVYGALPTGVDLYRSSNMMDYLASPGTEVRFDAPRSYGFNGTPVTGNITFPSNLGDIQNPTRASEGYMIKMLHNSGVEPTRTAPSGVQLVKDSGEYQTGMDNIFYFICHKNAADKVVKISYTIMQDQA